MKQDNQDILKLFQQKVDSFRGSHDFSHCDASEPHSNCYQCKRYIAHMSLQKQDSPPGFLTSYLSEPQKECVKKDYQFFTPF